LQLSIVDGILRFHLQRAQEFTTNTKGI
jgi:hypothetical protein